MGKEVNPTGDNLKKIILTLNLEKRQDSDQGDAKEKKGSDLLFKFEVKQIDDNQEEVEVTPTYYLNSLPLDKKIDVLNDLLISLNGEIEFLKNPSFQMHNGMGDYSEFRDWLPVDKPTAIARTTFMAYVTKALIDAYLEE